MGMTKREQPGEKVPDWVREVDRVGMEERMNGEWKPVSWREHREIHGLLFNRFLVDVRPLFRLDGGAVWFGPDDLAYTKIRPRHSALDVGGRVRVLESGEIRTLSAGEPFRAIVPGGFTVGGENLQKVMYLWRDRRRRFRLILLFQYGHAKFEPPASGRVRVFSAADQGKYLHTKCAFGQPIYDDGRLAGYEAMDWVRTPGQPLGKLQDGKFETKDPKLRKAKIPKGPHIHLTVRGLCDNEPGRKSELLNRRLAPALSGG